MREIKFRAWDGELMHEVSELHFCMGPKLDGKGLKFYGPGVGSGWVDGESIHLMQFTGLHDKNGKEIYEGDIVKVSEEYGGHAYTPLVVGFKDSCFVLRRINYMADYHPMFKYDFTQIYEVIGNRFENPEFVDQTS